MLVNAVSVFLLVVYALWNLCITVCTLLLKKSSKLNALVELGLYGSIFSFILPSNEFEILNNFLVSFTASLIALYNNHFWNSPYVFYKFLLMI